MTQETFSQYYAQRAATFDSVYDKPERQADLARLHGRLGELLAGHKVLEIACGTGYWTETIAKTAASVHATDVNPAMLEYAQKRSLPNTSLALADAWELAPAVGQYTAVFAGFLWSHIRREEQERFLAQLRAKLGKDVLLVVMDNCYVDGSSTVIARTDADGNTFQLRTSPTGERFEVLKNFPTDSYLRKKLAHAVREIRIERLPYYWLLTARLK
ncbi:class I SAM-dependent methyltransferase [Massilia sp. erpn]|uniref:class I SAM-dependent methyltransferase n=1 Tax=Massilia sp. erpn TaxID=2738142 RepID=UPI002103BFD9|nr:class I SAM-dependent methyltransferase [Massilia sp. erpn]UTY55716.1 class I SAM-dependent methyltransferase [Massilia sp. erpn]